MALCCMRQWLSTRVAVCGKSFCHCSSYEMVVAAFAQDDDEHAIRPVDHLQNQPSKLGSTYTTSQPRDMQRASLGIAAVEH